MDLICSLETLRKTLILAATSITPTYCPMPLKYIWLAVFYLISTCKKLPPVPPVLPLRSQVLHPRASAHWSFTRLTFGPYCVDSQQTSDYSGWEQGDRYGFLMWSVDFEIDMETNRYPAVPAMNFTLFSKKQSAQCSTKPTVPQPQPHHFPGATQPVYAFMLQLNYLILMKTIVVVGKISTIVTRIMESSLSM